MKPYKYLPKHIKQIVVMFDKDTVDVMLSREMYGELAYTLDIITNMYDDDQPVSQIHEEAIDYLYEKWGDDTQRVLLAMRDVMMEEVAAGKYKKQKPISREEAIERRQAALAQFDTIN